MKFQKLNKYAALLPEHIDARVCEVQHSMGHVEQLRWKFANNYGASLACHNGTYGNMPELAVLHNDKLCYDTDVTSDVIGYVTVAEVAMHLARIRGLPKR